MNSTLTPEALQRLADEDLMTLVERNDADAFAVLYDRAGAALARAPDRRRFGDRRGRDPGGIPLRLAQRRALRCRPRKRALVDARDRPQPRHRRAAAAPGPAPKLDLDDDAALESRPSDELTDSQAIRRETSRRVQGALRELPAEQSEVIGLAYFGASRIPRSLTCLGCRWAQ